jgi:hypothetical protein
VWPARFEPTTKHDESVERMRRAARSGTDRSAPVVQ